MSRSTPGAYNQINGVIDLGFSESNYLTDRKHGNKLATESLHAIIIGYVIRRYYRL